MSYLITKKRELKKKSTEKIPSGENLQQMFLLKVRRINSGLGLKKEEEEKGKKHSFENANIWEYKLLIRQRVSFCSFCEE